MTNQLPDGFHPHSRKSAVTDAWEPIYARQHDGVVSLGLRLDERHCNSRGFVHGGVIAALADNAMGLSYGAAMQAIEPGPGGGAVTLSLNIDFVATARVGSWLQIVPRVLKAGRSIGFVDALVTADDGIVARASATFKRTG